MRPTRSRPLLLVASALVLAACGANPKASAYPQRTTTTSAEIPVMLDDGQILAVLSEADYGATLRAQEGLVESNDDRVKRLAQRMVDTHEDIEADKSDVSAKNSLNSTRSTTSDRLHADEADAAKLLDAETGAKFDRQFVDSALIEGQRIVDLIDTQLLPQARSADLRALLGRSRERIVNEMKLAKDIRGEI